MSELSLGGSEGYETCAGEVRVERCGKSAPARRRLRGHVNPIRSNTVEKHRRRPGAFRGGGLSCMATCSRERWLSKTELGL